MRIQETPERLAIETTLPEFRFFGTALQAASIVFDRQRRRVRIRRRFLGRTFQDIPFAQIRRVRHRMLAPGYLDFYMELGAYERTRHKLAFPGESNHSVLSLALGDREEEVLYSRELRMLREGRDGRDVLSLVQGMADRISTFTGIPALIVAEEIQGSFDCGSKSLTLQGECLPDGLKGVVIPFGEIRALRSTKTPKGYHAAEICRKNGDVILVNEGFDSTSRQHETVELIARRAGVPFELQTVVTARHSFSRPYEPISPTREG